MEAPQIGMAQTRAVNQEEQCHVGGRNAVCEPAQERKMGLRVVSRRVSQTKDEMREVIRVRVGDDPIGVTESIGKGAIEAYRIAAPEEKTGKNKEEHGTRGGREP